MNCDECNGLHGSGGVKVENSALISKSNHGYFLIDSCVEDLVRLLNKAGVKTIASCCGHGGEGNLLISLESLEFFNIGEEMRVILKLPRAKDLEMVKK